MPLAILCSGGDSPGMNACIEFAYKRAKERGKELIGVVGGFDGLAKGNFISLEGMVEGIERWGGTIIRTSRGRYFASPEGKALLLNNIRRKNIEGVIVLGGDGSMKEGLPFLAELGIPAVGVPCTIDDDVPLTKSIGFDTACNKGVYFLDCIKDTALSLPERIFVLETLGGRTGHIALAVAFVGGADYVCIPELEFKWDELRERVRKRVGERGWAVVVVAEGVGGYVIGERLEKELGVRVRLTAIGHSQRGGAPSFRDRMLARALSEEAVDALLEGDFPIMVGWWEEKVARIAIEELKGRVKEIDRMLYRLVNSANF
ncbi:MAG: 6-phosphofructokinase [bacterium]